MHSSIFLFFLEYLLPTYRFYLYGWVELFHSVRNCLSKRKEILSEVFRTVEQFWDFQPMYFILHMACYCRNVLSKAVSVWESSTFRESSYSDFVTFPVCSTCSLGILRLRWREKQNWKNPGVSGILLTCKAFHHISYSYLKVCLETPVLLWRLASVGAVRNSA